MGFWSGIRRNYRMRGSGNYRRSEGGEEGIRREYEIMEKGRNSGSEKEMGIESIV